MENEANKETLAELVKDFIGDCLEDISNAPYICTYRSAVAEQHGVQVQIVVTNDADEFLDDLHPKAIKA